VCGIAGLWTTPDRSWRLPPAGGGDGAALVHRGPTTAACGRTHPAVSHWVKRGWRCSISRRGQRPNGVARERYWIATTARCTNFLELRAELELGGGRFRSMSDAEVVLAAFERWGAGA